MGVRAAAVGAACGRRRTHRRTRRERRAHCHVATAEGTKRDSQLFSTSSRIRLLTVLLTLLIVRLFALYSHTLQVVSVWMSHAAPLLPPLTRLADVSIVDDTPFWFHWQRVSRIALLALAICRRCCRLSDLRTHTRFVRTVDPALWFGSATTSATSSHETESSPTTAVPTVSTTLCVTLPATAAAAAQPATRTPLSSSSSSSATTPLSSSSSSSAAASPQRAHSQQHMSFAHRATLLALDRDAPRVFADMLTCVTRVPLFAARRVNSAADAAADVAPFRTLRGVLQFAVLRTARVLGGDAAAWLATLPAPTTPSATVTSSASPAAGTNPLSSSASRASLPRVTPTPPAAPTTLQGKLSQFLVKLGDVYAYCVSVTV